MYIFTNNAVDIMFIYVIFRFISGLRINSSKLILNRLISIIIARLLNFENKIMHLSD